MENKETVKSRLSATDLVPRIVCVLVALILWLYVIYNDTPDFEKSFNGVMATITNTAVLTDKNLTIYGDATTPVEIVITGRRGDIFEYTNEDIAAIVDVSSITEPGDYNLPVSPDVPDGVTVKSYYPKTVAVHVQLVTEKVVEVIVKPRYTTSYTRGEPVPAVSSVVVKGPASVLESVSHVEARPSFDAPLTSSITASAVELVACTKSSTIIDSPYLDLTPSEVDVDIPIYDERDVDIKAALLNGYFTDANSVITLSPSTVKLRVKISGGKTLDNITDVAKVVIDETKFGKTDVVEAKLELAAGVENLSGTETVKVSVRHRNTAKKDITVTNIELENPNGLDYTLPEEGITVTLRAPIGLSLELDGEDFVLSGSLADIKDGKVPVTVTVPDEYGDSVYALGEYFVSVDVG